jgi:DNA-binding transcriptional LysR family regulator
LNLFRVFEAIMRHRSVSGASRELGVTASAVSHALSRLRQALGDDLFVSADSGMEPTARARDMAPRIRDGLGQFHLAVGEAPFEPSTALRTFRIAATDYVTVTVLPPLIGRLARVAPQIDLRVFPLGRLDTVGHLDDGRLDFAIGWFGELPERMRRAAVFTETEAIVVRSDHPLTHGPVTTERLFAFPHLVVEITGTEEEAVGGFVDDRGVWRRTWIERLLIDMGDHDRGLVGRVAVSVPHYGAVLPMLTGTDMVATLPRRIALRAAQQGGYAVLDLPYAPLEVTVEIIRHQRADRDSGAQWFAGELIEAMQAADRATAAAAPE